MKTRPSTRFIPAEEEEDDVQVFNLEKWPSIPTGCLVERNENERRMTSKCVVRWDMFCMGICIFVDRFFNESTVHVCGQREQCGDDQPHLHPTWQLCGCRFPQPPIHYRLLFLQKKGVVCSCKVCKHLHASIRADSNTRCHLKEAATFGGVDRRSAVPLTDSVFLHEV